MKELKKHHCSKRIWNIYSFLIFVVTLSLGISSIFASSFLAKMVLWQLSFAFAMFYLYSSSIYWKLKFEELKKRADKRQEYLQRYLDLHKPK
jgi:hypothetical protein